MFKTKKNIKHRPMGKNITATINQQSNGSIR